MFKKKKTKSPIKAYPLRYPGQSVQEMQYDTLMDKVLPYLIGAVTFLMLVVLEWSRYYFPLEQKPIFVTLFAVIVLIVSIFKIRSGMKKIHTLRQGRVGEQAVGQYLDGFRGENARVLHDIPCENFNIDHIVIHENGVFLIETKTYSKPISGQPLITHDGESIYINSFKTISDPVKQASISSIWLHKEILKLTGEKIYVKPVVVFPGWMVEKTKDYKTSDVWVLNPKSLKSYIDNQKHQLEHKQVRQIYSQLGKYVREKSEQIYNNAN